MRRLTHHPGDHDEFVVARDTEPIRPASAPAYPHDREAEIVLRDGSTVHVRPVRAEDRQAMRSFLEDLSTESIGFRFFGTPRLDWAADWSVDVDTPTGSR